MVFFSAAATLQAVAAERRLRRSVAAAISRVRLDIL
jgi:hypothetical protein